MLASLAEWLGLHFNGNPNIPTWLFLLVKCADYILTPAAGGSIIRLLPGRSIWKRMIVVLLIINTLFQLVSVFTGWMIEFDDQNYYSRGPLYPIYIAIYILMILFVIMDFFVYGRRFRKQNKVSLYATLVLVNAGVLIQEFVSKDLRTAYLALTLGVAVLFIHNTEYSQQVADDAIQKQRLQIMLSQIQPHFFSNCLAVIRETYRTDPEKGEQAITQFSEYLRHNMDTLVMEKPITFSEELVHVKQYLALQELRFGDELNVSYDLEVTDFRLPTLVLQPIVENAVTYGVRKQSKHAGHITICSREYPDRYEIIVTDNGPGFDPSKPEGRNESNRSHVGIQNVRDRLDYTCGGKLNIVSVPDEGTTVTISIPKDKARFV